MWDKLSIIPHQCILIPIYIKVQTKQMLNRYKKKCTNSWHQILTYIKTITLFIEPFSLPCEMIYTKCPNEKCILSLLTHSKPTHNEAKLNAMILKFEILAFF